MVEEKIENILRFTQGCELILNECFECQSLLSGTVLLQDVPLKGKGEILPMTTEIPHIILRVSIFVLGSNFVRITVENFSFKVYRII